MDLKEISLGNLIKFFPTPGRAGKLGFKANELIGDNSSIIISIGKPYIASKEMLVYIISDANDYNSSKVSSQEGIKIKDINIKNRQIGVIAWTGNPFGLIQNILILGDINEVEVLIAPIEESIISDESTRIADLGPIGSYIEPISKTIKICPNCNHDTLITSDEEINNFDIVATCKTCGIKVALSWS